ncbi:MAG: HD domain-containing protein [Acidobacteria bacterium]|nr:HD domain-containing protein [Acidobacteriota bacterium]
MVYTRDYDYLEATLSHQLHHDDLRKVRHAYEVAEAAHAGQLRDEGTPYIVHPVRVAVSLVDELEIFSPQLICSALLHDVIEDSPITREEVAEWFDQEIAHLVWLLTKLDSVSLGDYLAAIEAAADSGAPLVKLCDRLDNLRFLSHSPRLEKKRRYIRTTEHYYLPMAARSSAYLFNELHRALEVVRQEVAQASPDLPNASDPQ